jgi:ribosomal protein S18 acetylase RimI-like enzyme
MMEFKFASLLESQLMEAVRLYSEVWGENSIDFTKRFKRHANYPGFHVVGALVGDNVVGFAYGYTSTPGQYYHDLLRKALTNTNQEWWLEDCYEIVELVVHPDYRRKKLGQGLVTKLLDDAQNRTALLTTQSNNISARKLYEKLNWETLEKNFRPGDVTEAYVIMGKNL